MLIALEGLPGAGKTTSAELVAERLGGVAVCETTGDHPFLKSVYQDDDRYDLEVELAFLLLHSSAWRRIDRTSLTVADFARHKDVLFAEDMLRDAADLRLFTSAYDHLYKGYAAPDVVVYLKATPELCLARARQRGRDFEKGMTMERLTRMKRLYEARLSDLGDEVLVLDLDTVLDPGLSARASMAHVASAIIGLLRKRALLPSDRRSPAAREQVRLDNSRSAGNTGGT